MCDFFCEKIGNHIYRIKDKFGVAMYLVIGTEKCCLIDTGYGVNGLKKFVQNLSDLPIKVFITHGHIDHASGIFEFDDVYMNHLDLEVFLAHTKDEFRMGFINKMFGNFNQEEMMDSKRMVIHDVKNGERVSLGDVHIRAFHVPGHTLGTMMYLIEEERMIIFGDACGPGTLLLEDYSADIKSYHNALLRIKETEHLYDRILRCHGTCESSKSLLDNVIAICEDILNDRDDKEVLPDSMKDLFPLRSDRGIFRAKKTVDGKRVDGKEGNISYRIDKV